MKRATQASCRWASLLMPVTRHRLGSGADADAAQALIKKSDCGKCHAVDKKKDGPSFKETAAKYKGKPDAEARALQAPDHLAEDQDRRQGRESTRRSTRPTRQRSSNLVATSCRADRSRVVIVRIASGRRWTTRRRLARCGATGRCVLGLGALVLLVAVLLVIGGAAGLAWTSTEQFCIGCHEMRDNVVRRVQGHDPRQATAPACARLRRLPRAARARPDADPQGGSATRGVGPHHRQHRHQGKVREAPPRDGAQRVDAHEEHRLARMPQLPQVREAWTRRSRREKARARHAKAKAEGMTCIDCHFGIAHKEPDGPGTAGDERQAATHK